MRKRLINYGLFLLLIFLTLIALLLYADLRQDQEDAQDRARLRLSYCETLL